MFSLLLNNTRNTWVRTDKFTTSQLTMHFKGNG